MSSTVPSTARVVGTLQAGLTQAYHRPHFSCPQSTVAAISKIKRLLRSRRPSAREACRTGLAIGPLSLCHICIRVHLSSTHHPLQPQHSGHLSMPRLACIPACTCRPRLHASATGSAGSRSWVGISRACKARCASLQLLNGQPSPLVPQQEQRGWRQRPRQGIERRQPPHPQQATAAACSQITTQRDSTRGPRLPSCMHLENPASKIPALKHDCIRNPILQGVDLGHWLLYMHLALSGTMRAMPESSLTASSTSTASHRCCSRSASEAKSSPALACGTITIPQKLLFLGPPLKSPSTALAAMLGCTSMG